MIDSQVLEGYNKLMGYLEENKPTVFHIYKKQNILQILEKLDVKEQQAFFVMIAMLLDKNTRKNFLERFKK